MHTTHSSCTYISLQIKCVYPHIQTHTHRMSLVLLTSQANVYSLKDVSEFSWKVGIINHKHVFYIFEKSSYVRHHREYSIFTGWSYIWSEKLNVVWCCRFLNSWALFIYCNWLNSNISDITNNKLHIVTTRML